MLARPNRLLGKQVFERVREKGKILQSTNFGVSFLKRSDSGPSRFGFVVSTKISKRASHRNRIKRVFREAVKEDLLLIKPGYDIVFLAKKTSLEISKTDLIKEINDFLNKPEFIKR